jgi:hypothetical protein
MKAKELRIFLDKFLTSPVAQQARVQIEILNIKGVRLAGSWKMPKIVGKL